MNRISLLHTKLGIYMTSKMLPAGAKVYVPLQVEDMRARGYCGIVKSVNATSRRYIITKSDENGAVKNVEVAQSMALRYFSVRDMQYPNAAISGEVSCINHETRSLLVKSRTMHYGSVEGCAVDHRSNPMYYLVKLCAICGVTGSVWFLADDVAAGYNSQDHIDAVSTFHPVAASHTASTPPRDAHKELSSSALGSVGSDDDDAKQQIMQKPLHVHDDVKKVRQRAIKFNFKHDSPKTKAIFVQLASEVPWLRSRREQKSLWIKHLDELFKKGNATELRGHKDAAKSFSAWAAAICRARKMWRLVEGRRGGEVEENDAVDDVSHMWETKVLGDEKLTSSYHAPEM